MSVVVRDLFFFRAVVFCTIYKFPMNPYQAANLYLAAA